MRKAPGESLPRSTETPRSLHPLLKAAILSVALAVTGCAKDADIDGGDPNITTEQAGDLDGLTEAEIAAMECQPSDYVSDKYEECLTSKPAIAEYAGGKYLQCVEDKSHRGYHTELDYEYVSYPKASYAKSFAKPSVD